MSKQTKGDAKNRNTIIGSVFATKNPNVFTVYKIDGGMFDKLSNIEIGGRFLVRMYDNEQGGAERGATSPVGHLEYASKAQVEDFAKYIESKKAAADTSENAPF